MTYLGRTRKEGRKEGREKGRKEGREKGRKEGREKGRKEGREKGRKEGKKEGRYPIVGGGVGEVSQHVDLEGWKGERKEDRKER